jgi:hypothetical protein
VEVLINDLANRLADRIINPAEFASANRGKDLIARARGERQDRSDNRDRD